MTSQSFFDRFTAPRRSSLLPVHSPPQRLPSEYDLDELDPRPDGSLASSAPPREYFRSLTHSKEARALSPDRWDERATSAGSASKLKGRPSRAMFAGPPPPIASSTVLPDSRDRNRHAALGPAQSSSRANATGSVLFGQQAGHGQQHQDSAWRGLRRQERVLESDLQQLLDLQAAGLIAGLGGRPPTGDDFDIYSDAGSSTPTETFYSTATSKSRMINSLHMPARANADGNVIPVRQPKKTRPIGLRAARGGLRKTMISLANLKAEEDAQIDDALAQRKRALLHLDRLSSRRDDVNNELHSLEDNDEEPLGLELRDLGAQYDTITKDIQRLEEKLVGMRNRRRVVKARMEDVRNQREAGLSGFRGALRDVEGEVTALMRRPPIQPLDPEIFERAAANDENNDAQIDVSGGLDFLRMIPERRTADMARTWWQTEIAALERRKLQIATEHRALEDGGILWAEAMALVTDFESRLRSALKGAANESSPALGPTTVKGKGKTPSQEEVIREQLPLLEKGITELEGHMRTAESRGWNLLICAVGAELEAFREAHELLCGLADVKEEQQLIDGQEGVSEPKTASQADLRSLTGSDENEVPNDLLVSEVREDTQSGEASEEDDVVMRGSVLRRVHSSDNDVPAEFFAEHDKLDKLD